MCSLHANNCFPFIFGFIYKSRNSSRFDHFDTSIRRVVATLSTSTKSRNYEKRQFAIIFFQSSTTNNCPVIVNFRLQLACNRCGLTFFPHLQRSHFRVVSIPQTIYIFSSRLQLITIYLFTNVLGGAPIGALRSDIKEIMAIILKYIHRRNKIESNDKDR